MTEKRKLPLARTPRTELRLTLPEGARADA
jgi:hypothetical protein